MTTENPDMVVSGDSLLDAANTVAEPMSDTESANLANALFGIAPPEQAADETEVTVEDEGSGSEETSEETIVETQEEVGNEDDDSIVEDDTSDEEETEPSDDELTPVDYDEAKNFTFPIKIKGDVKQMSLHEIQNQLAQVESAGKASREAAEDRKALEAERAEFEATKESIQQLDMTNADERHLVVLDNAYRVLGEQMENANGEQYKNLDLQRQKIANEFYTTQSRVNEMKAEMASKIPAEVASYVPSNASADQVKAVKELLDKASKWDAYQSKAQKGKPKLQGRKTLGKGSGQTAKSTKSKVKSEADQRLSKGVGSIEDTQAALNSVIKGLGF